MGSKGPARVTRRKRAEGTIGHQPWSEHVDSVRRCVDRADVNFLVLSILADFTYVNFCAEGPVLFHRFSAW